MPVSNERVSFLLHAWSSRTATLAEEQEFFDWISDQEDENAVHAHIKQLVNGYAPGELLPAVDWEALYEHILEKRESSAPVEPLTHRLPWKYWVAAAAIILLLSAGTYWLLSTGSAQPSIAGKDQAPARSDIAPPAASRASLSLPDGTIILLDSVGNGSLANAGARNASKQNNELVYHSNISAIAEWHTLSNPRGSKPVHLQLADGSSVWLNAASSVTFPTIFAGSDRKVEITGEAYLEVAKDALKKFSVTANGITTEVLGTHFNINAYQNESDVRVTLLEGAVNVASPLQQTKLKPGQQAQMTPSGNIRVISDVNTEEVIAWKNNRFEFSDADIYAIMRQIERWYDVEVVFADKIPQQFNGSIHRQVNVSRLLDMLEKTGGVRFEILDKKVIVKKY